MNAAYSSSEVDENVKSALALATLFFIFIFAAAVAFTFSVAALRIILAFTENLKVIQGVHL